MENRKLIIKNRILVAYTIISLVVIGALVLNNHSLKANEIIIGSDNLSGYEDFFGSTVAIYVEQTEGEGDYIQKNNVPDDGSVYTVNSATHCIGGGNIGYNNSTHKLSYLFDQADECYVYLDKVTGSNLSEHIFNLAMDWYIEDQEIEVEKIKYDSSNNIIDNAIDEYAYEEARYVGTSPNNYVWFNCDASWPRDDASENASHCEKWRIIGVMNENTTGNSSKLVKIIRDYLGGISWDYKGNGTG